MVQVDNPAYRWQMTSQAFKFYNCSRALSYNAPMSFVLSARGTGKTYSFLRWLLKRAVYHGEQFCYTRSTAEECDSAFPRLYDNHNQANDCFGGMVWHSKNFLLWGELKSKNASNVDFDEDTEKKTIIIDGKRVRVAEQVEWDSIKVVATAFPIIRSGVAKGIGVPLCRNFLYDEFIPEDGKFKPDVVQRFHSIRESLFRHRENDCRCFFLGNYATSQNPWFDYYGIPYTPERHFIRKKGVYVVETYKNPEFRKAKLKMAFTKNLSKREKAYLTSNAPLIPVSEFVKKIPEAELYGVNQIFELDNIEYIGRFYKAENGLKATYFRPKRDKDTNLKYALSCDRGGKYVFWQNGKKRLRDMIEARTVLFADSTTRARFFSFAGVNR